MAVNKDPNSPYNKLSKLLDKQNNKPETMKLVLNDNSYTNLNLNKAVFIKKSANMTGIPELRTATFLIKAINSQN